jgi:hypothetical protein
MQKIVRVTKRSLVDFIMQKIVKVEQRNLMNFIMRKNGKGVTKWGFFKRFTLHKTIMGEIKEIF